MGKVNLIIDGKAIVADESKTVLEAALDNGIYIPHLCHHDDLHPNGGCRLCVVKQDGVEGVITSCSTKVILNSKGYSQEDYNGCMMTALFAEGVPGLVGDDGYTTAHHFYCYENLMDTETSANRFTRLVVEANLDGTVYYYPVDINQPGYGWDSSIGHKGVKRNTCYTYNFTITGPGSDDPESKIVLKTITLDASVESLTDTPEYSVSF